MLNIRAGNVLGIPIRLHASWLVLLVLGVSSLQPMFATEMGGSGIPLALITTLLLLLAILLHEVGHAWMAQHLGLKVKSITLFLTGGITELEGDVQRPGHEFKIALAGPAVSFMLTLLTAALAWWLRGEYRLLCGVLAFSNGLLTIFNMLPCYPLDGGRAVRAIFWFLHDDLLEGTHIASKISRVIGGGLILVGVSILISGNIWTGLLVMLLGWGTSRSAISSYLQTALHYTLSRISVGELMSRSYRSVSPQLTLEVFVSQYLLGQGEQGFPVVQSERLLGIITTRNLRRFSIQQWRQTLVSDAMTPHSDLPPLHPSDSAHIAYYALTVRHIEQLPVTDGEMMIGMIRHRDVLAFVQKALKQGEQ